VLPPDDADGGRPGIGTVQPALERLPGAVLSSTPPASSPSTWSTVPVISTK
jgi:hypothetical protein